MPAIGVAQADINASAAGRAVVSGRLIGFNTNGFIAGDNVYVGVDGALTQTKPTGSALIQNIGIIGKVDSTDGEMVVLGAGRTNDVPNIAENYLWLGNSDGVATAVVSSSIKVDDAISASYAVTASHALQADNATTASHAITSSQAISSSYAVSSSHALLADNLVPGDITHTGAINSSFAAPGGFAQKNLATISGVTFNGTNYPIAEAVYMDFGAFGDQFANAFGFNQWNGFSYTAGAELLVAPQRVQFNLTPDGGGTSKTGVMAMQSGSLGEGSQLLLYGNELQIGSFRGQTIKIGNRSGNVNNQTENILTNAVTSSTITDYNYESATKGHYVTGGTRGNTTTITNAGSGNNSFLSLNGGNFYELDISTSSTILALNTGDTTAGYAQTFQIKVINTTNTLTFDSNFKFPGGTAPTISANGTDILTGTYFGGGGNEVYITNLNNFF